MDRVSLTNPAGRIMNLRDSTRAIVSFVLLLFATGPRHAGAAITLDADFDSGSLKSYSVVGNTINLVGRGNFAGSGYNLNGNHWRWLYFKASGVQGLTPTFSISRRFAGDSTPGPHELTDHEMVYSYDGFNWQFFPHANNTLLNIGTSSQLDDIYTFHESTPFVQNDVYVSYAIPYPYARTTQHTQQVLASPWASPTLSGDASGVIGHTPAGTDDLGRPIPSLDLYAYRITNPATDGAVAKRHAIFTTGQHAAETLGVYTYEGLVDWLISDDPRAAALRDRADFFCYPALNASGRYAGLTRAMLPNPNSDSNGYWNPGPGDNPADPYDSEDNWINRPEQKTIGEAMLADFAPGPGRSADLLVDFHSSVPDYTIDGPNGQGTGGRDDWGYITHGKENNLWWLKLKQLQPSLLQVGSGSGPGSETMTGFGQSYFSDPLNPTMAVTLENQFAISRPISYYHDLGKNVGIAMSQAWVQVQNPLAADFDEDGQVDAADLAAWQLGAGLASGALHYQGDANADGRVDGADFLIWQRSAASASAAGRVPESTSLVLAAMAASMVVLDRHRRKR
jgi:hypothetical protein